MDDKDLKYNKNYIKLDSGYIKRSIYDKIYNVIERENNKDATNTISMRNNKRTR